jgi:hypothetical protein
MTAHGPATDIVGYIFGMEWSNINIRYVLHGGRLTQMSYLIEELLEITHDEMKEIPRDETLRVVLQCSSDDLARLTFN